MGEGSGLSRLFCFGLGYSAEVLARRLRNQGWQIAGTARDPANLERLAAALRELDARIYTEKVPEGLPFDCSRQMLARADVWNLITKAGRLDLAFTPSGTAGFPDLAAHAVRFELYGHPLLVARLEDIIRSKEAAGRPKDRQDVELMKEMLKSR